MVEYRKAEEKDAETIAHVLVENYNIKDIEEAKKVFLEELGRYHTFVAEEDGKVIGISSWRQHGLPKHQLAEIGRVAVLDKYRGKGIATELLGKIIREADRFYKSHSSKLRKLYVYVHSSNKKAQNFYKDKGLIEEAVLKDHYYKGEDEFIYSMFMD